MKKLMIAAAAVAMVGGVYAAGEASPCGKPTVQKSDDAWVYQWKFTGKTTDGVNLSKDIPGVCDKGESWNEAIRVPCSLKIQGYTAKCNPNCHKVECADFAGDGELFYIKKPTKGFFPLNTGVSFKFCNVIGRIGGKVEMLGTFKSQEPQAKEVYDFTFAGQGTYNRSKLRVTSISGNFAGKMATPHAHVYDAKINDCPMATVWDPCFPGTRFLSISGRQDTAVFGKWSMKYSATKSYNFAHGITLPEIWDLAD